MLRVFVTVAIISYLALPISVYGRQDAQAGELVGQVVNGGNHPLADTFVLIHTPHEKDITAQLDSQGRFEIPLRPGLYYVFMAAGAYIPQCKVVEITEGHKTALNIKLKLDQEHLQRSAH
jgi:hypothetical protein